MKASMVLRLSRSALLLYTIGPVALAVTTNCSIDFASVCTKCSTSSTVSCQRSVR